MVSRYDATGATFATFKRDATIASDSLAFSACDGVNLQHMSPEDLLAFAGMTKATFGALAMLSGAVMDWHLKNPLLWVFLGTCVIFLWSFSFFQVPTLFVACRITLLFLGGFVFIKAWGASFTKRAEGASR